MKEKFSLFLDSLLEAKSDLKIIRELLESGLDPNYVYPKHGNTAMRAIAQDGSPEVLRLFVDAGANINERINYKSPVDGREEFGYTPIFYAFDEDILKEMLLLGADVNAQANDGETALMRFSRYGCPVPMIKALLQAGADVSLLNDQGHTALDYAERKRKMWLKLDRKHGDANTRKRLSATKEIICVLKEAG